MGSHFPWGEDVREHLERAIYGCRGARVLVDDEDIDAALGRIRHLEDENAALIKQRDIALEQVTAAEKAAQSWYPHPPSSREAHPQTPTTHQICEMIRLTDRVEALEEWRRKLGKAAE